MKLFGTEIVYGLSPEARVFAHLLGRRPDDINAKVLMHQTPGECAPVDGFKAIAKCDVIPFDTGWRINKSGKTGTIERAIVAAKFKSRTQDMVKFAKDFGAEVIYSSQQHYDCSAATTISQKLDKPQIIHLHYIIGPWLKQSVLDRLLTCDHVITVSEFIRDEALRHGVKPESVTAILNAMEPMPEISSDDAAAVRADIGVPKDAFLFGNVSRIDPGKGQADVISAFEIASSKMPDSWLVIVGNGAIEAEIREKAEQSPVSKRIICTGRRNDVPRLLGAMDAFVHPSRMDPCPLALLESLASGLPAIAYKEGGAAEMIINCETGILAPVADVDALSNAMESLYSNPEMAKSMGAAAKERIATKFRPDDASLKFAEVLRQVAG